MKKIFLSLLALTSLLFLSTINVNCKNNNSNYKMKFKSLPPSPYLLDSLQGSWANIDDSLNKVKVSNNRWIEFYLNAIDIMDSIQYKIYLSDTLIIFNDTTLVSFDTTLITGKYIVLANDLNVGKECYYLNGFTQYNGDTTFSISPTYDFKARFTRAFQKIP